MTNTPIDLDKVRLPEPDSKFIRRLADIVTNAVDDDILDMAEECILAAYPGISFDYDSEDDSPGIEAVEAIQGRIYKLLAEFLTWD